MTPTEREVIYIHQEDMENFDKQFGNLFIGEGGILLRETRFLEDMIYFMSRCTRRRSIKARIEELTCILLDPLIDMELDKIIRKRIVELQESLRQLEKENK